MRDRDPLEGTSYRSVKTIGAGSMGEVTLAEHKGLKKPVVVKLMRAELAQDPEMLDRFRLEAQALASLDRHPNIVQALDVGTTPDGRPYLAMEHLVGRNLREECRARGLLAITEAVELCQQALAGLAEAHAAGILHRDIKPENLFLCAPDHRGERVLKILDFGIARVDRGARSSRSPAPLARPTAEGFALGTPRFIAPEQALGKAVDARADLYAVGGVLYWLLTGRDPFHHRNSMLELFRAHLTEVPAPPSSLIARPLPASLDAVVLRALAKRPQDRFSTAEEFSEALAGALREQPAHRWLVTERLDTSMFSGAEEPTLPVHLPARVKVCLTSSRVLTIVLLALVVACVITLCLRSLP